MLVDLSEIFGNKKKIFYYLTFLLIAFYHVFLLASFVGYAKLPSYYCQVNLRFNPNRISRKLVFTFRARKYWVFFSFF